MIMRSTLVSIPALVFLIFQESAIASSRDVNDQKSETSLRKVALPSQTESAAYRSAIAFLAANLSEARDMSVHCDAQPITDWPNYQGRMVRRCQYIGESAGKTLPALVYLLNPSKENIATRISTACRSVGLGENSACGTNLACLIVDKNGAQFPVAGFVVESRKAAGGKGDDPVYLEFRDGNTIESMDHLNFTAQPLSVDAMEHAARAPVAQTRTYARIANATRADYVLAGGTRPVGKTYLDDKKNLWPTVIRENELRAQDTGDDALLRGNAIGIRGELTVSPDKSELCKDFSKFFGEHK